MTRFFTSLAALAVSLAPASGFAGDVSGVALFKGTPPERRPIDMRETRGFAAKDSCTEVHGKGAQVLDEDVLVSEKGGVANVFVFVKSGLEKAEYPLPEGPAVLDQVGCMYTPRIQGMRAGQALKIRNSDPMLHNVRSYSRRNPPFNIGQPQQGDEREKVLRKPEEAIKIKCDVHKWMEAYVFVMDHPFYATTDADGKFSIPGLPPGKYTIEAWHEKFGERKIEVEVGEGPVEVEIGFEAKAEAK